MQYHSPRECYLEERKKNTLRVNTPIAYWEKASSWSKQDEVIYTFTTYYQKGALFQWTSLCETVVKSAMVFNIITESPLVPPSSVSLNLDSWNRKREAKVRFSL